MTTKESHYKRVVKKVYSVFLELGFDPSVMEEEEAEELEFRVLKVSDSVFNHAQYLAHKEVL